MVLAFPLSLALVGGLLYQQHVMPGRPTPKVVFPQAFLSDQNVTHQTKLPEIFPPNHTHTSRQNSYVVSALSRCVEQVGLFNQHEVDMITAELRKRPNLREHWPLVFTHIPKTGGTTVAEALNKELKEKGCGTIRPIKGILNIKKGKHRCFVLDVRSGWKLFPWGIFSPNEIRNLPPLRTIIAVEGHVPFGVCRFFDANCSYTTILREPLERYVSHVRWECFKTHNESLRPFCNSSIAEYTRALMRGDLWFYGVDNHQTRMLSGDMSENSLGLPCFDSGACNRLGFREVGPTQLRIAIRNIAFHYPVLGLLEDLDGFSKRLKQTYGYPIKFIHKNKGIFSGMDLNLTEETYKDLQNLLAADLSLYRFVKCILDAEGSRGGEKRTRRGCCADFSEYSNIPRYPPTPASPIQKQAYCKRGGNMGFNNGIPRKWHYILQTVWSQPFSKINYRCRNLCNLVVQPSNLLIFIKRQPCPHTVEMNNGRRSFCKYPKSSPSSQKNWKA